MKSIFALFILSMTLNTWADTTDSKTFVYDGTESSAQFVLSAAKTHTEYRMENQSSICYRQVIAGYRRVCYGGGVVIAHGPRRPGYPVAPVRCHSEPQYRSEPYSCVQSVSVPYEVKDYDVEASVAIDVTKFSETVSPGESFKVTLKGDVLTITATGSKKFFIVNRPQEILYAHKGNKKLLDAFYAIELIDAAPVLSALQMDTLSVKDSVVSFTQGGTSPNVSYGLKVERLRTFGSDTVLFNRNLAEAEYEIAEGSSEVSIDTKKLGFELEGGRFSITPKLFVKTEGSFLNSSQYEELSASKTLIYKNR